MSATAYLSPSLVGSRERLQQQNSARRQLKEDRRSVVAAAPIELVAESGTNQRSSNFKQSSICAQIACYNCPMIFTMLLTDLHLRARRVAWLHLSSVYRCCGSNALPHLLHARDARKWAHVKYLSAKITGCIVHVSQLTEGNQEDVVHERTEVVWELKGHRNSKIDANDTQIELCLPIPRNPTYNSWFFLAIRGGHSCRFSVALSFVKQRSCQF